MIAVSPSGPVSLVLRFELSEGGVTPHESADEDAPARTCMCARTHVHVYIYAYVCALGVHARMPMCTSMHVSSADGDARDEGEVLAGEVKRARGLSVEALEGGDLYTWSCVGMCMCMLHARSWR